MKKVTIVRVEGSGKNVLGDDAVSQHRTRPMPATPVVKCRSAMGYYLGCFVKYADFRGRACRKEFNCFWLFNWAVSVLVAVLCGCIFGVDTIEYCKVVIFLATLLPFAAVGVRRLHDVNRSGWWLLSYVVLLCGFLISAIVDWAGALLALVGFIGTVYVGIISMVRRGTIGDNKYGPDPLASDPLAS